MHNKYAVIQKCIQQNNQSYLKSYLERNLNKLKPFKEIKFNLIRICCEDIPNLNMLLKIYQMKKIVQIEDICLEMCQLIKCRDAYFGIRLLAEINKYPEKPDKELDTTDKFNTFLTHFWYHMVNKSTTEFINKLIKFVNVPILETIFKSINYNYCLGYFLCANICFEKMLYPEAIDFIYDPDKANSSEVNALKAQLIENNIQINDIKENNYDITIFEETVTKYNHVQARFYYEEFYLYPKLDDIIVNISDNNDSLTFKYTNDIPKEETAVNKVISKELPSSDNTIVNINDIKESLHKQTVIENNTSSDNTIVNINDISIRSSQSAKQKPHLQQPYETTELSNSSTILKHILTKINSEQINKIESFAIKILLKTNNFTENILDQIELKQCFQSNFNDKNITASIHKIFENNCTAKYSYDKYLITQAKINIIPYFKSVLLSTLFKQHLLQTKPSEISIFHKFKYKDNLIKQHNFHEKPYEITCRNINFIPSIITNNLFYEKGTVCKTDDSYKYIFNFKFLFDLHIDEQKQLINILLFRYIICASTCEKYNILFIRSIGINDSNDKVIKSIMYSIYDRTLIYDSKPIIDNKLHNFFKSEYKNIQITAYMNSLNDMLNNMFVSHINYIHKQLNKYMSFIKNLPSEIDNLLTIEHKKLFVSRLNSFKEIVLSLKIS